MPATAKVIGSAQDFSKIPVKGLVPESAGSAPASPVAGQLWFDTSLTPARLKVYENSTWVFVSNSSIATADISDNAVTLAKLADIATDSLIGRDTAGAGDPEVITVGGGIEFTGAGALRTSAFTGDVTKTAGGTATTIANDAVTYAKMQNVSVTDRLLGRDTAAAGDVEELTVGGGIEFTGAGGIQTSALTGDVTKAAGGTATTIANLAVTLAKLAAAVNLSGIASTNASTADITASGFKITNLGTPTAATDAATKGYVDGVASGLDPKGSVRVASSQAVTVTYNATGGTSGRGQITAAPLTLTTIDAGTAGNVVAGDRILLKNQATAAQNGIWVVTTVGSGANGVWDRATDFDTDAEVTAGAFAFVEEGTVNADTGWVLTTNNPITIGGASGTSLTFAQFSSAGSYTGGAGLTLTGSDFAVNVDGSSIEINADTLRVKALGITNAMLAGSIDLTTKVTGLLPIANGGTNAASASAARTNLSSTTNPLPQKYAADLAAITAGVELVITHNLNTLDVICSFRTNSDGYEIVLNWRAITVNTVGVTVDFPGGFAASAIRAVVIG